MVSESDDHHVVTITLPEDYSTLNQWFCDNQISWMSHGIPENGLFKGAFEFLIIGASEATLFKLTWG
jgi:hypothetical protein